MTEAPTVDKPHDVTYHYVPHPMPVFPTLAEAKAARDEWIARNHDKLPVIAAEGTLKSTRQWCATLRWFWPEKGEWFGEVFVAAVKE